MIQPKKPIRLNQVLLGSKLKKKNRTKQKRYKQHFRKTWKLDFDWLKKVEQDGKTGSFCTVCRHSIEGSKSRLERHNNTKAHIQNYRKAKGTPKITSINSENFTGRR